MAKDKSEKKEKKEKKEKRSEVDGVKKAKKEKKEKKDKVKSEKAADALLDAAETNGVKSEKKERKEVDLDEVNLRTIPKEALVPFANPLADEKMVRKILKGVKKGAKYKVLKRGVKETVKCVRKTDTSKPSSSGVADPVGIVVLAADISPMDVISHIPVLCEDHNIPYVFVPSRAELGMAGNTKRPTSVVMVGKNGPKGKAVDDSEFKEAYGDLLKLVLKAGASVKI